MEMKTGVLFVTLFITTFLSKSIGAEEPDLVCGPLKKNEYTYCKTEDVLTSVTSRRNYTNDVLDTLIIDDTNIFEVSDNAFNNNLQLGDLTLNLGSELNLHQNAFVGLDNLTSLQINNGRVLLNNEVFKKLTSLTSLKFEASERDIRLNEFLFNLENLIELELLKAWETSICQDNDGYENVLTIEELYYTFGRIANIKTYSFMCLNNLRLLSISQTHLRTIERGAFNVVEKLEHLILTMNKSFKKISVGIFDNFISSIELDLHGNSIEVIEAKAFNSKRTNFLSIDLSSNKLSIIKTNVFYGVQCEVLDLSSNNISIIEEFAFNQSKILGLFVFGNPLLQLDGHFSELSIFTTVYNINSLIFIKNKIRFDCTLLEDRNYEVCFDKGSLQLVREIDHVEIKRNDLSISTLEISKNITSIEEYAFYNLSMKELVIKSEKSNRIDIKPLALYLPKLEILEFHGSPILLKKNIFKKLISLIYLTLKVVENNYLLCQLLPELLNIKYLTIVDHDKINICDEKCSNNKFKLINLGYDGGNITEIRANALECLELENFEITNTNLKTIEVNAFDSLKTLMALTITGNKYLTHIPSSIFDNLKQLYVLVINNFYITRLDSKIENVLKALDSNENMVLINLNENKLVYSVNGSISQASWKDIILSSGEIILTSDAEGYTKKKSHIFFYNTTDSEVQNAYEIIKNHYHQVDSCSYRSSVCSVSDTSPVLQSCINTNGVLTSVTNMNQSTSIRNFELDIGCIETIGSYAFMNSTITNSLSIKSYIKKLKILRHPFSNMQNMKTLRFIDSVIKLDFFIFNDLPRLENLILSFDEFNVPLCKVLKNLPSLIKLHIINHNNISICNEHRCKDDDHFRISKLYYNGGAISLIKNKSFKCVTLLNYLFIVNANISTIESEAFYGLIHLEILSLAQNRLTFISKNIFQHLKKLKVLFLQFNYIQEIESTTFQLMNVNLLQINLDFNKFDTIKTNTFNGLKCDSLYLSSNDIRKIEDDAFNNSYIKELYYFDNPQLNVNLEKVRLTNFTTIQQNTGTITEVKSQPKKSCKLLCENCYIICETAASKIAQNIRNEEKITSHLFDNQNSNITKHFLKHTKSLEKCEKYCENCPVICRFHNIEDPILKN